MPFTKLKAFAIDLETTGLDPETDRILEIGMTDNGARHGIDITRAEQFSINSLVHYDQPIPCAAKAIHLITEKDVAKAPPLWSVVETVMMVLDTYAKNQRCLVAHNAPFDSAFLPELEEETWICTQRLAKHLLPGLESYGLQYLRFYLDLDLQPEGYPHRAFYDAQVCMAVFTELVTKYHAQIDIPDDGGPEALRDWCNRPCLLTTINFGKHRGERFADLPYSYLDWMERQERAKPGTWDSDTLYTIRYHLEH